MQNTQALTTYFGAREKMNWIDPVAYEHIRMLHNKKELNENTIRDVFT
jgi:predicted small metal-binding protein